MTLAKRPAAHAEQAVAPAAPKAVPRVHGRHAVEPEFGWYDPTAHEAHAVAPLILDAVADGQNEHTDCAGKLTNCPVPQATQDVWPVWGCTVPLVAPVPQETHTDAPDTFTYVPTPHGKHDKNPVLPE